MFKLYTLNVGQGQFSVLCGDSEAIIIDAFIPSGFNSENGSTHVIGALAQILRGLNVIGVIITGFDRDHFSIAGIKTVCNKYRPDWIAYPKYFKDTKNADDCFDIINQSDATKIPIDISKTSRKTLNARCTSDEFSFNFFSPHSEDANSSNNSSIVCKITHEPSRATYLVTGDTEKDRLNVITSIFGTSLKADVLDAPHHGANSGCSAEFVEAVNPTITIISAGTQNKYGHPHAEALQTYKTHSQLVLVTGYERASVFVVRDDRFKYGKTNFK